ncbi:hypothetical protein HOY80DRAFT_1004872 [Tuber brumale]|nr:hypothetical protein HOY80DRAFT_1004872 [Tuber brumale]
MKALLPLLSILLTLFALLTPAASIPRRTPSPPAETTYATISHSAKGIVPTLPTSLYVYKKTKTKLTLTRNMQPTQWQVPLQDLGNVLPSSVYAYRWYLRSSESGSML